MVTFRSAEARAALRAEAEALVEASARGPVFSSGRMAQLPDLDMTRSATGSMRWPRKSSSCRGGFGWCLGGGESAQIVAFRPRMTTRARGREQLAGTSRSNAYSQLPGSWGPHTRMLFRRPRPSTDLGCRKRSRRRLSAQRTIRIILPPASPDAKGRTSKATFPPGAFR